MKDEKFIDYFIAQSEEIMPDGSVYWIIRKNENEILNHINSPLVKQVCWTKHTIHSLISNANQFDKLVLHSFFFPYLNSFLRGIRKDIKVIWMFWGGDGYGFTSNDHQWYLPLTRQYKKSLLKKNVGILRYLVRIINTKRRQVIASINICSLIRRVNICATWVKYDYEMIRHINPKMEWTYYSYFTAAQMGFQNIEPQPLNTNRLWLGNSATDTNNHLDALHYLKAIQWQGEIVVPLSYGSKEYAEEIKQYGLQQFGTKFIPLTDFMPLEQYQQYMNSCGIVWMNHIRQQAAGNTLAALYMGKVVIMNSNNNLHKTLANWGVYIERKNILSNTDGINKEIFNQNKEIIVAQLSREKNLTALGKIYDDEVGLLLTDTQN